jgi:cytochrome b involved in lipid metabolism
LKYWIISSPIKKWKNISHKKKLKNTTKKMMVTNNFLKKAWVIIKNTVYDVTKFLQFHPGGKKILLNSCGTDATQQFLSFHKETTLEKYSKFAIGKIKPEKEEKSLTLKENVFGDGISYVEPAW